MLKNQNDIARCSIRLSRAISLEKKISEMNGNPEHEISSHYLSICLCLDSRDLGEDKYKSERNRPAGGDEMEWVGGLWNWHIKKQTDFLKPKDILSTRECRPVATAAAPHRFSIIVTISRTIWSEALTPSHSHSRALRTKSRTEWRRLVYIQYHKSRLREGNS